jgi:hypothetical protein
MQNSITRLLVNGVSASFTYEQARIRSIPSVRS